MLIFREAQYSDLDALVEVTKTFWHEGPGALFPLDEKYIKAQMSPLNGPDSVLVVAEDEKLLGYIYYRIVEETPYSDTIRVANEIVWHCDPSLSGLKRIKIMAELAIIAEQLLIQKGANLVEIGTQLNHPAPGRLLSRLGYTETSIRFRKEL